MKPRIFLTILALLLSIMPAFAADMNNTVYNRIMQTRTIKCGYILFPTFIDIDPNTKKMSGYYYDLMTEIGKELDLKVEWSEEINIGNMLTGLKTRYDMICMGPFIFPSRAKAGLYSQPTFTMPANIYVRANDNRFDNKPEALNQEKVTFSGLDGDSSSLIVQKDFPKAKLISLPENTTPVERIMMVTTQKVDASILEVSVANQFMIHNPGKIKPIMGKPYKVYPMGFIFPLGEYELKALFDSTLYYMNGTGMIQDIISKHQALPGDILPPALVYGGPVQK